MSKKQLRMIKKTAVNKHGQVRIMYILKCQLSNVIPMQVELVNPYASQKNTK